MSKPAGRSAEAVGGAQQEALRQLVEAGPDPEKHGVVRWRCVDLQRVLGAQFGVDLVDSGDWSASSSGLASSHISAPPACTPHRMRRRLRLFKKNFPALVAEVCEYTRTGNADRGLVPG